MKQPHPNFDAPPYMSPYSEMPPPMFRHRHNPASPGPCPSPVGPHHGMDRSAGPPQPLDHQHAFLHGMDHNIPSQMDRVPYHYGSERHGQGRTFDRPSSPRMWNAQVGNGCFPRICGKKFNLLLNYYYLLFFSLVGFLQGVGSGNPRGIDNSPSFHSRKGSLGR